MQDRQDKGEMALGAIIFTSGFINQYKSMRVELPEKTRCLSSLALRRGMKRLFIPRKSFNGILKEVFKCRKTMEKSCSVGKNRGFVYPALKFTVVWQTYGITAPSVELKNNAKKACGKIHSGKPLQRGVDCAILMNPRHGSFRSRWRLQ